MWWSRASSSTSDGLGVVRAPSTERSSAHASFGGVTNEQVKGTLLMRSAIGRSTSFPHRIRRAVLAVALIGVGLGLATNWAWGAHRAITLEQLAKKSEQIVVGKVERLSAGYYAELPGTGRVVFTDVTIRVSERWKSHDKKTESRTLVLQVPGGRLPDGSRMLASGAPRFKKNEQVLVFVSTHNKRPWVFGWEQGKYEIIGKRVDGRSGLPIAKDILTYALEKKIRAILGKGK